ncbi:tetratricopeptide repeat protein [Conexibacter stalactiti]|uniref:O-antigen ligase family protein n=1 Tax=Conexibacter stalactiti TaxID=1940611 RepID=A0ABU4HJZ3_9ACTN|nr:tetratricopeptide repeat protein [Conexibacter stalactiti]MDW5593627.1 O-antigen ligase family protein [Conexibacter stalactiti]MEC5034268.1 tetratricopeptide repeat protein [Conexibacter stalactiti]
MSSLADAPEDEPAQLNPPAPQGAGAPVRARSPRARLGAHPDLPVTLALAALIVAISFTAAGGSSLHKTTAPEIALTLIGTAAVALAALLSPAGRPLWGGVTVLLFGALTALTAISITWSVAPSDSWLAANLTLAYFAAFAGAAALVRIAAGRWAAILGGVVLAALVISGWALLVKVFPSLEGVDTGTARLRAPYSYWNAVGLMAVIGIPGCLWVGARRDGHAALRALSVPALTLLLTAMLLAYSRGALLATLLVIALWFAIVPLRLRGAAMLLAAGAGTLVVGLWSFGNDGLAKDGVPLDVRADAGHDLGLLLLTVLIVTLGAGLALAFATSKGQWPRERRQALGGVLLVLVALLPVAAVGKLALSDRGLTGSVKFHWNELTDPDAAQPGNDPGRFGSAGGVRARYWDDAFTLWKWNDRTRWAGVGADGYRSARRALQRDRLRAGHAHGYVPQTLADLGLSGLLVNLLLLVAWLAAVARATALLPRRKLGAWAVAAARSRDRGTPVPRRPAADWTPERIGLVTLAVTAIGFGVHSAVDWTWFVPGTAVAGLICAGWVAGRGPLADPPPPARLPGAWRSKATRVRLALAAAIVLIGLAGAWTIWQPLRASNVNEDAQTELDAGRLPQALSTARDAHAIDPLSVEPLFTIADVLAAQGRAPEAVRVAQEAVELQPANPDTWIRLSEQQLAQNDVAAALQSALAAAYLDRFSPVVQGLLTDVRARAGIPAAAPTP